LNDPEFQAEWFITRIKPHIWAMDEIYRHMLASEIFYIHSKFEEMTLEKEWSVGAQWVGDRQFGFKEGKHFSRKQLFELTTQIENKSQQYLKQLTVEDLKRRITAPWGEEMSLKEIVNHCFEHDHNHRGQIQFLITFFQQQ
jgi:uncharacterized damage-inducible protein DinB